ncbi:putative toxin-antitoxin system toxin component, PIN family [Patescibacteria group bacterium]|nr:putative toxin-antitoxin system toxin component, PIN family [Patescibacteria group bacterium]MBU4099476.1 putative toxin-antitoxin system toxin component, PIN family [Patescibacteria group bacterium]
MNVLFDANVLISYLLISEKEGTIVTVVEAGFKNKYQLHLPQEVIKEVQEKITKKEYLAQRISQSAVEKFVEALCAIAIIPSNINDQIPEIGRDFKDDYLLAYGIVGECDYLVTGDDDLLVLKQVENLGIVTPSEFLEIIKEK